MTKNKKSNPIESNKLKEELLSGVYDKLNNIGKKVIDNFYSHFDMIEEEDIIVYGHREVMRKWIKDFDETNIEWEVYPSEGMPYIVPVEVEITEEEERIYRVETDYCRAKSDGKTREQAMEFIIAENPLYSIEIINDIVQKYEAEDERFKIN